MPLAWWTYFDALRDYGKAWGLTAETAEAYAVIALSCAWHFGEAPTIISGRRDLSWTIAAQSRWDAGDRSGLAVRPATGSLHHDGRAFDLDGSARILRAAADFALSYGVTSGAIWSPPDPRHVDMRPA